MAAGVNVGWMRGGSDIDPVFADILAWRAKAIAVAGSAVTFAARERSADLALRNRLPSASAMIAFAEVGGLRSDNAAGLFAAEIASGAEYIDRIFRGARPADMPVKRPDN